MPRLEKLVKKVRIEQSFNENSMFTYQMKSGSTNRYDMQERIKYTPS